MFFKRKISINEYLTTRLDLLFSAEQAERWLEVKKLCGDEAFAGIRDDLYLMHLRAAHIQLLYMVVIKRYYRDLDLLFGIEAFIDQYLDGRNEPLIKLYLDLYSDALGSSAIDGVLAMTGAVMESLCHNACCRETLFGFRSLFYGAVASIRADFKQVKLVPAGQQ